MTPHEADWFHYVRWCCARYCAWAIERRDPGERAWHASKLERQLAWLRGTELAAGPEPAMLRALCAQIEPSLPWLSDPGPGLDRRV